MRYSQDFKDKTIARLLSKELTVAEATGFRTRKPGRTDCRRTSFGIRSVFFLW